MSPMHPVKIQPIGVIHTPYRAEDFCPNQPVEREEGQARIVVEPEYQEGLADLASFRYIYVLFHLHRVKEEPRMLVNPPWVKDRKVSLFATRSPHRPVPIGLSVVRLREIRGNELITGLIDVYDGTPLLDIKPYIKELDAKTDANYGWIEEMEGYQHLLEHVRGVPHGHNHHHHDDEDHHH